MSAKENTDPEKGMMRIFGKETNAMLMRDEKIPRSVCEQRETASLAR